MKSRVVWDVKDKAALLYVLQRISAQARSEFEDGRPDRGKPRSRADLVAPTSSIASAVVAYPTCLLGPAADARHRRTRLNPRNFAGGRRQRELSVARRRRRRGPMDRASTSSI